MTNLQHKTVAPATTISPTLPIDFIGYIQGIGGIFNYIGNMKTHKDLQYVYAAWKDKMQTLPSHPVVKMLEEAQSRGLLGEKK